ncbi:hypothetical protein ONS96_013525 [Cadophora gregata f. sp. sojae]|nr:hypothetical protein ONS96_013525 [Cadophora gregata f. sp. sojae]
MRFDSLANGTAFLINALPQSVTNGATELGTLGAPTLPKFLPGPMLKGGSPWRDRTVWNTNPSDFPDTGFTRPHKWEISVGTVAPDGVVMNNTLSINGAYPGPLLEANWGDWIEVEITNNLCCEGTSLHWHGLLQRETPWMDGVPGVTQCPIAPNSTFTYRFRADSYGTSWWHSHYSAQYVAAAQGPMIIYVPTNYDYDIDLGPVMLSDWFHLDYWAMVEITMLPNGFGSAGFFSAESILINGKMNYDCSLTNLTCTPDAGVSKFRFESGKKHRLRLINSGSEPIQKFSIDGHTLTVIAVDFVPIVPYATNVVTLVVGQRTDVVVEATGKASESYWMRSETTPFCSDVGLDNLTDLAAVYYEGASTTTLPLTNSSTTGEQLMFCDNDDISLSVPEFAMPVPEPSVTIEVHCVLWNNGTHNVWYMNNISYLDDYNDPDLLRAKLGNLSFPEVENVYNFGSNTSVRMVVYNHMALASHPMHIHGHNFYILDSGVGNWTDNSTVINPSNPMRRDTPNVQKAVANAGTAKESDYQGDPSYVVVQFDMDNPGVWPFHCHIAWHVSDGFVMVILERPDDIEKEMQIPGIMAQTCRDWASWTVDHVVDQIDSGL